MESKIAEMKLEIFKHDGELKEVETAKARCFLFGTEEIWIAKSILGKVTDTHLRAPKWALKEKGIEPAGV